MRTQWTNTPSRPGRSCRCERFSPIFFRERIGPGALKQYAAVLKLAPRRFNATAGAARAAAKAGDTTRPAPTRCSFSRLPKTPKRRDRSWPGRALTCPLESNLR